MARSLVLNRKRQVPAEDTAAFGAIAERFRRAGDLDRAIGLCREGLEKFPDHLSARTTLGWSLIDQGKYDEAQAELEQVLKRAPDNLAAIRGLAELHDRTEGAMSMPVQDEGDEWTVPETAQVERVAELAPLEDVEVALAEPPKPVHTPKPTPPSSSPSPSPSPSRPAHAHKPNPPLAPASMVEAAEVDLAAALAEVAALMPPTHEPESPAASAMFSNDLAGPVIDMPLTAPLPSIPGLNLLPELPTPREPAIIPGVAVEPAPPVEAKPAAAAKPEVAAKPAVAPKPAVAHKPAPVPEPVVVPEPAPVAQPPVVLTLPVTEPAAEPVVQIDLVAPAVAAMEAAATRPAEVPVKPPKAARRRHEPPPPRIEEPRLDEPVVALDSGVVDVQALADSLGFTAAEAPEPVVDLAPSESLDEALALASRESETPSLSVAALEDTQPVHQPGEAVLSLDQTTAWPTDLPPIEVEAVPEPPPPAPVTAEPKSFVARVMSKLFKGGEAAPPLAPMEPEPEVGAIDIETVPEAAAIMESAPDAPVIIESVPEVVPPVEGIPAEPWFQLTPVQVSEVEAAKLQATDAGLAFVVSEEVAGAQPWGDVPMLPLDEPAPVVAARVVEVAPPVVAIEPPVVAIQPPAARRPSKGQLRVAALEQFLRRVQARKLETIDAES